MSVSADNAFISYMKSLGDGMLLVASKFPLKGMQSFTVEGDGKFTIVYEKENFGTPTHSNESWSETMKEVSVKVRKVITGKFDAAKKNMRIDPGCIVARKGTGIFSANISLTGFKASGEKTVDVSGKWGILPEGSDVISHSTVMLTNMHWKS